MIELNFHVWDLVLAWGHAVAFVGGVTAIVSVLWSDGWKEDAALERRLAKLEGRQGEGES